MTIPNIVSVLSDGCLKGCHLWVPSSLWENYTKYLLLCGLVTASNILCEYYLYQTWIQTLGYSIDVFYINFVVVVAKNKLVSILVYGQLSFLFYFMCFMYFSCILVKITIYTLILVKITLLCSNLVLSLNM